MLELRNPHLDDEYITLKKNLFPFLKMEKTSAGFQWLGTCFCWMALLKMSANGTASISLGLWYPQRWIPSGAADLVLLRLISLFLTISSVILISWNFLGYTRFSELR